MAFVPFVRVVDGETFGSYKEMMSRILDVLEANGKIEQVSSGTGAGGYNPSNCGSFDLETPLTWGKWRSPDGLAAWSIQAGADPYRAQVRGGMYDAASAADDFTLDPTYLHPSLGGYYYLEWDPGNPLVDFPYWTYSSPGTDPLTIWVAPDADDYRFFCAAFDSSGKGWFLFFRDDTVNGPPEETYTALSFWTNGGSFGALMPDVLGGAGESDNEYLLGGGAPGSPTTTARFAISSLTTDGDGLIIPNQSPDNNAPLTRVSTFPMPVFMPIGATKSTQKGELSFLRWLGSCPSSFGIQTGGLVDSGKRVILQQTVFMKNDPADGTIDPTGGGTDGIGYHWWTTSVGEGDPDVVGGGDEEEPPGSPVAIPPSVGVGGIGLGVD